MIVSVDRDQRIDYLDNLRALAMFAGVLFHAGLAYSPIMHRFWPTSDVGNSVWMDVLIWFLHLFRMPLFFVVAGFFAALLVQQRGVGGMLHQRAKRVLLPLVVFWPFIYLATDALTMRAIAHTQNPSPLLVLIKQWLMQPSAQWLPPSLMHLWFLYYLMCFCVLIWVVRALELAALSRWFTKACVRQIALALPLVLVPALVSVTAPTPAPESVLPQWWALLYFGCYFFIGYQLYQRRALVVELKPYGPALLTGAVLAYASFFWLLHRGHSQLLSSPVHWVIAVLQAYAGFWMTLYCLQAGRSWLNAPNRFLRYFADASYWVYLVHLPILFAIQYPLLDLPLTWPLKLLISLLGTCSLSLASYQLLVRATTLGALLNGKRTPRP
jgi:glucans biosynthesis protein C